MGEWIYRSTFSLVRGEWWAARPGRFTHGERAPGTHRVGGWVDPEPVWMTWRRENSWPYRKLNSDPSVVQPVASRYTDCTIPTPQNMFKIMVNVQQNVGMRDYIRSQWGWEATRSSFERLSLPPEYKFRALPVGYTKLLGFNNIRALKAELMKRVTWLAVAAL
jgi:hypothetical protein